MDDGRDTRTTASSSEAVLARQRAVDLAPSARAGVTVAGQRRDLTGLRWHRWLGAPYRTPHGRGGARLGLAAL